MAVEIDRKPMEVKRVLVVVAFLAAAALVFLGVPSPSHAQELAWGLTAIPGLKVGHFTLSERPTGCTVVLAEGGAVGGVDVRGGAPGTREIALLDPVNSVQVVHAVVLSGGSAFGLDAASGVVRYLDERDIGYRVGPNTVPIVVGAILFDLSVGDDPSIRPDADCGYRAATHASSETSAEGNVGARPRPTPTGKGGAPPRRRIQLEGLRGATADARAPEGLAEVAARDRQSMGARAAEQCCKNRNRCTSKNVQFLSSTRFPGNRGVDWPVVSSCLSEL